MGHVVVGQVTLSHRLLVYEREDLKTVALCALPQ